VTTSGVAQSRTANAQNEVTQVGGSTLSYSRTGNLTTDAQGRTLGYDGWNRLVSVKNASNIEIARYEYDGLNRRIVEQVGTPASPAASTATVRDVYYSADWQVLEERLRTSTGAIPTTADTRFIWGAVYVDALIARDRNADADTATGTGGLEERVYALQDANWNTTAIVAASGVSGVAAGSIISRFAYTPYGESQTLTASWEPPAAGTTPATPWAHLFQGLEFTDVTGLAHARNRDYSASLGRFMTLDPIGFQAGDNNWYRFVENGPTNYADPSGLHKGHHLVVIQVRRLVSKVAFDVFDSLDARISNDAYRCHNGGRINGIKHFDYNTAVIKEFEKFVAKNNINPKTMTAGQAADFLNHLKNLPGTHLIKQFNKGVQAAADAAKVAAKTAATARKVVQTAKRSGKLARAIPVVGAFFAVAGWGVDGYCKGPVNGTINSGIDAIPIVGGAKILVELTITGDWIPDAQAAEEIELEEPTYPEHEQWLNDFGNQFPNE